MGAKVITELKQNTLGQRVEIITFDRFLELSNVGLIDVLKIDIEGFEYKLFDLSFDLIFSKCKIVVIELHEPATESGKLIARIKQLGFVKLEESGEFLVCRVAR